MEAAMVSRNVVDKSRAVSGKIFTGNRPQRFCNILDQRRPFKLQGLN
jgi:hypothetical protein